MYFSFYTIFFTRRRLLMKPFEKYTCYTQSQFEYWYQQDQEKRTNICKKHLLDFLRDFNGLDNQHKQELFQRCFRDICLDKGISIMSCY